MSPRLGEVVLASQSDERLVKLARAGHERAFAVIVERYRPELTALARRLSPDGKAEDIVQQAFLSAFAALRSGADVKHLRGWLYRIVRNAAARTQAPLCMPLDGGTASGESVEDVVQQRDVAMNALAEVARLPHRQRQAIVGTALDGRGRAEVATAMGVSEGAVRQLVHRARARIRTAVTAVTPWPMVRWLAAAHPDSGRAGVAAGASAASSGGVALKVGMVLASGAIATGIAVVDNHRNARRPDPAGPRAAARDVDLRATRGGGRVLGVAPVASVPVRSDSSRYSHAGAAEFVVARVRVRRGGDGVAARPERRREGRGAGSLRGAGRGNGAGSRWSAGAGPGRYDGGGGGGSGDGGGSRYGGGGRRPDGQSSSAPTAEIANDGNFTHGGGPAGYGGSGGGGPGSASGFGSGPGSGGGSSAPGPGSGSGTGSGAGPGPGPGSSPGSGSGVSPGTGSGPSAGAGPDGGNPTQANTGASWAGGGSGR